MKSALPAMTGRSSRTSRFFRSPGGLNQIRGFASRPCDRFALIMRPEELEPLQEEL